MKLILASGVPGLYEALKDKDYDIVANVKTVEDLRRIFSSSEALATTMLVTEKMENSGSLINTLIDIREHYPEVRIIFLATGTLEDKFAVNQLHMLVSHGIYDLYYEGKITIDKIQYLIDNPKLQSDCRAIEEAYKGFASANLNVNTLGATSKNDNAINNDAIKNNIVAVTSVKPGTGKSFVSSNLAVTLAKYGKKEDGTHPRVLLLEGDLQTLSVTTLFGIKDDDYNLKTALDRIEGFMDRNNDNVNLWFTKAEKEKQFIDRCCLRTNVDNLYVLEGHDFDFNDIATTNSATYYYLTSYLATKWDVIVIDSNSSLQHPTTDPIFQLAKTLYFVFTTDFNNLKLNIRYQEELKQLGVLNKIKYVLNKALYGEQKLNYTFEYDDKEIIGNKLRIDYEIPLIDMAVILNSTYKHVQLCSDTSDKTLFIREKFLKLANDVMPLGGFDDFNQQLESLRRRFRLKK